MAPHWSPGNSDLAASGVTPGTYGDATHVGRVTVNAAGLVTAAADVAITGGGGGGDLASGKQVLTTGDIAWTASAFAVIDAALNITITTAAHRCLVLWTFATKNSGGFTQSVDVELDGARLGGAYGLVLGQAGSGINVNFAGSTVTDALAAGSHTFKLMFRTDSGTSTIYASSGVSPVVFSVVELYA